jgi:hypothetical protein
MGFAMTFLDRGSHDRRHLRPQEHRQAGDGRGARTKEGKPMSVEIVMTRESFDCLEKLIPKEVSEGMQAPVFLQASGTTPHQVVLTCSLEIAEKLLELARPSCERAAEDIRIAIAEYRKSTGGA